ncbi:uncharacterized protein Z520_12195 [Fonsecaea multimorphosa CBS 102226]|uniref:Tim44-like domain-containing protein n=1 Tax=Fonsecaea multimorphosa CBS 102226 TaxID=1442371 RepID=A0A0D2I470_9EURO|nr:uncharacterized protein Z520_12195 [Fonsecaea multimorphosa CBS 102226]KIX92111.1 hypothetical protein Z520_12195 [Fonsecaea multimorphosa CBS 102226]OAL17475.1 hypothetical protein AYO22_11607 [Fonsecaea multimorphosa]
MAHPVARISSKGLKSPSPLTPSGQSIQICPQCAHRLPSVYTRQFTTTRRRNAAAGVLSSNVNIDSKLPKHVSVKSQMKKANRQQIGTDLGKLPQTLVLPAATDLPAWMGPQFMKRTRIHWLRFKTALKDWWSLVVFLRWDVKRDPVTGKKMRKPLELSQRHQIARDLHKEFHEALGEGDLKRLQAICCEGLLAQARTRVEQRKAFRRTKEPWKMMSYSGIQYPAWLERWPLSVFLPKASTRVVSDRLAPLPFADTYLRQCIVRIRSVQNYFLADRDKDSILKHIDYVVIQKMTIKGEEGPWKVWGLTEPSTMKEIDTLLEGKGQESGTTLVERIQDKISGVAGA